ncbi:MAG TPA: AraC family transcriptional regulator [Fontimonas sp.]
MAERKTQGWISVRHLQHIVAMGQAAGIGVDELLGDSGVGVGRLADAEGAIPLSAIEAMLASISRRHALPLVGLQLANDIQPATFGPLGHLAQTCRTFGEVIDVTVRFNGLLSNIGRFAIERRPGAVELSWSCLAGGPAFRRQASEYVLGALVVMSRYLLPNQQRFPLAVGFSHAAPETSGLRRAYFRFFKCPVHFDQPTSSITIPVSALATRMPYGDAQLKGLLEQHAVALMRQRAEPTTLVEDVRQLVKAMLADGAPSRETVAAQLGISSRSLHRKLEQAGTFYGAELKAVRLSLAMELLRDDSVPVRDVAARLGFSTQQAFLKWFKQLTGKTPGACRSRPQDTP